VLYPGDVMHARLKPFGHRFVYRVFSLLVDLDRLGEIDRMCALFRSTRAISHRSMRATMSERAGETVRAFAIAAGGSRHRRAGGTHPAARLPPHLRLRLQPISVYFAYDREGRLIA